MSKEEWQQLFTAKSYEEAAVMAKSQFNVCLYRRSDLKNQTKYSLKCSQYRKYPLCSFEIQIIVPDSDQNSVIVMSRSSHQHQHEERNSTTRLPSPIRQSISKYVHCGLSQYQLKSTLKYDHPSSPINETKLINLINYERRKNRPEIFSIYDLKNWCDQHKDGTQLHSIYVPFYTIENIDNIFIMFITKQLFQQIKLTNYIQVDATYKLTWNELPLLVFGSTDANRHFKPLGIALVSHDENEKCYEQLFVSINALSVQEFNQPCFINYLMADGAAGITCAQEKLFPQGRRLMCWFHMIKNCRQYRKIVPKGLWPSVDADIHSLQLSFCDDVFNRGVKLLLQKWNDIPGMKNFSEYFANQWITKLPYWYEGAAFSKPSTNNGCESMNAIIKEKYTLRNKLQLSAFLPKIEIMLKDWSEESITSPFSNITKITSDLELQAYQWSTKINRNEILHWFNTFYVIPSSVATMTTSQWLQQYQSSHWESFQEFLAWQKSCWLVSPLISCTCPVGLKQYTCKHSVGLAIIFNMFQVTDITRCEPLGKRKAKGRPKKVRTALFL